MIRLLESLYISWLKAESPSPVPSTCSSLDIALATLRKMASSSMVGSGDEAAMLYV